MFLSKNLCSLRGALAAVCLLALAFSSSPAPAQPADQTKAKRTYRNPFIFPERDMADPDVIKVNGTYYLYPTSSGRGYEVFVSTNLLDWERKGRAFRDRRGGVWAPDLFYNQRGDGKFYLYYTDNPPNWTGQNLDKEVGVAVADSPLGPFVDKGPLAAPAIDAEMFQDDDRQYYLYYVNLAGGFKIVVQPMSDPLTRKGDPTCVIHPTEPWEQIDGKVTEGPFMLKRNGTYYLMFSGTGANSPNYAIGYATAKSPAGPFTKYAGNPIAHRGKNLFGPGHHCVVEGPDHNLWMIYHQKVNDGINYTRFLAIDPLWFDEQGIIHTRLSRGADEPGPSN